MAIGLYVGKSDLDFAAGRAAQSISNAFTQVRALKAYLDAKTTAELQALELAAGTVAYTSGEVASLKSAVNDLDQLRTIYEGAAALPAVKDFRAFVKLILGVGF
ncbi:MAG TPA: hypothetical protein VD866_32180 [Urbifossiella sp.]|nr:hypothetical protein [Urbifossiella sp.]